MNALHDAEELHGELVDSEDIPLGEVIWIARRLDLSFDGRLDMTQEVPVATGIEVDAFVGGTAIAVLYAKNTWAGSRVSLNVHFRACSLVPDAVRRKVVHDVEVLPEPLFRSSALR